MKMVNKARTLLLNCHTAGPGSEFVSPAFEPLQLTHDLQKVWTILFGVQADDYARNYRVRQLLTIIHSCELADFVYKLDPRVTYWPTADGDCLMPEPDSLTPLTRLLPALEADLPVDFFLSAAPHMAHMETLWHESPLFNLRLGALVLAFIYRVEELT